MFRVLKSALAVAVLAIVLAPYTAQAREERLLGQIVGTIIHEEETPDGLVQLYSHFGDFSRLGVVQGYGVQLVGPRGEILWGVAVFSSARGESYAWYAADRRPDGALDGWFFLDGHTARPDHYGYGSLGGMVAEPRLRLSFDGILSFPD